MALAELWTRTRNLNLSDRDETIIYLLGRIGREPIPPELLVWLATHPKVWRPPVVGES